ncbi:MAG: DVUA0089 family protein [Pseudomonadota bacterium]
MSFQIDRDGGGPRAPRGAGKRTLRGALLGAVAMGALAGPAAAQELCAGLGNGAWIGGDAASSDVSAAAGPLDQSGLTVPPSGNVITYFSVSTPGQIRVEALPDFGGDTVLELYDASGNLLLTDDDGGGNLASQAETFLDTGQYCMLTRGFGGGAVVADIRIARTEFDTITGGIDGGTGFFAGIDTCTPDTPATLLGNGPLDALLAGSGVTQTASASAAPYYRFTLSTPQPLTIRADNEFADPYIYVFDSNGQLVAENDDFNSLNARIDFTEPLAAGTYCVGMRALSNQQEPISLSIAGYDPQQAMFDMYAMGDLPPPPGSGYPITDLGALSTQLVMDQPVGGRAVYYSFSVPESGLAMIDAIEVTDSDPVITLFDSVGREIAWNDDANGSLDSQIVTRLDPGSYTLGVTQYSSSYTGVIRVSLQRFVPAQ